MLWSQLPVHALGSQQLCADRMAASRGRLANRHKCMGGVVCCACTCHTRTCCAVSCGFVLCRKPIGFPLPDPLGPVFAGYIAIFTLGISLISSTMFSEAMWQRVWASASRQALYGGASIGCIAVIVLVFLSGFGGWLSLVGGLAGPDTNQNLILMELLNVKTEMVTVSNWVGVLVVLLALIMNEGAVDSLQNGLAASISAHFLKNAPLAYTR